MTRVVLATIVLSAACIAGCGEPKPAAPPASPAINPPPPPSEANVSAFVAAAEQLQSEPDAAAVQAATARIKKLGAKITSDAAGRIVTVNLMFCPANDEGSEGDFASTRPAKADALRRRYQRCRRGPPGRPAGTQGPDPLQHRHQRRRRGGAYRPEGPAIAQPPAQHEHQRRGGRCAKEAAAVEVPVHLVQQPFRSRGGAAEGHDATARARHARPVVDDRRRHVVPQGPDQPEDPQGPPPCQRRRPAEHRGHDQARHPLVGRLRVYRRGHEIAGRPARSGGPSACCAART